MKHKKELVDALRSGKYPQIKGHLRSTEGYCCLGVACELVDSSKWSKRDFTTFIWDEENYFLPPEVRVYFGFTEEDPIFEPSKTTRTQLEPFMNNMISTRPLRDTLEKRGWTLSTLNDGGVPFSVIADIIERDFPESPEEDGS